MPRKAFLLGSPTLGLKYADDDVRLIANAFQHIGFDVSTASGPKHNILRQYDEFCDTSHDVDIHLFYFSGHALLSGNDIILIVDNDIYSAKSRIPFQQVLYSFRSAPSSAKIIILDCCHALRSLAEWHLPPSDTYWILAASRILEVAKEVDALHSSFLTFLLHSALTDHSHEIVGDNGNITLATLYQWIKRRAITVNNDMALALPIPHLVGEHDHQFVLGTAQISPVRQRLPDALQTYIDSVITCVETCETQCYGRTHWCRAFLDAMLFRSQYITTQRVRHQSDAGDIVEDTFDAYIQMWLVDCNRPRLAILGDYGIGKTAACIYILHLLSRMLQNVNIAGYVPVFIPLALAARLLPGAFTAHSLLNDVLKLAIPAHAIDRLIKQRRLLFLLDGFDEIGGRADYAFMLKSLERLRPVLLTGCKVILTSRTHFFANNQQVDDVLAGKSAGTDLLQLLRKHGDIQGDECGRERSDRFEVCELQEFASREVLAAISAKLPEEEPLHVWDELRALYDLGDLCHRPILLKLILETLPELKAIQQAGTQMGRVILYDVYTRGWIRREAANKDVVDGIDEQLRFIERLAFEIWSQETLELHHTEIVKRIAQAYTGSIWSKNDILSLEYTFRNASFLNRDIDGNYRFMHKSFLEFFTAKNAMADLVEDAPPSWRKRWFDKEVASFLAECVGAHPRYDENVKRILGLSLVENDRIALWNYLHILSLLRDDIKIENISVDGLNALVARALKEPRSVILRQYCRIAAKVGKLNMARELIDRVIGIVQDDTDEKDDTNQTYINCYGGRNLAADAMLMHLKKTTPTYDRRLHIYILGQLGSEYHVVELGKIASMWPEGEFEIDVRDALMNVDHGIRDDRGNEHPLPMAGCGVV